MTISAHNAAITRRLKNPRAEDNLIPARGAMYLQFLKKEIYHKEPGAA